MVAGGNVIKWGEFLSAAGESIFTAVCKAAAGGIGQRGWDLTIDG